MKNKSNYIKSPLAWAMVVSLAFLPVSAFADKGGKDGDDNNRNRGKNISVLTSTSTKKDKDDSENERENRTNGCSLRAFGHLFASGWLRRNTATSSVPAGCVLPPGIAKKLGFFNRGTGTTTDTTAPVLSSIVVTPATTTAMITWNTNEGADSAVFFSTSLPVNTSATATQIVSSNLRITTHSLQITNLSTSTTYFVVVRSRDASGNTTFSSPLSFTTGTNADITAPIMSSLVAVVGTSTLRFTWNTNEPATSKVFYSTATPVNVNSTSTPFVEDLAFITSHSVNLIGLATSTLYHIVVQSKDAVANTSIFSEFPLTTTP